MSVTTVRKLRELPRNAPRLQPDSRPAVTKSEDSLYKIPMDKLTERTNHHFANEAVKKGLPDINASLDVWLEAHPEFGAIDQRNDAIARKNTEALFDELLNPEMLAVMKREGRAIPDDRSTKGWRLFPNFWDLDMAYSRAQAKGNITLDPAELHKQRCEAVRQQVSLSATTEDELYEMDLHELRRRATPGTYDPLGPQ